MCIRDSPKSGTVTMDVAKAVKEVKQGKIDFKVDKSGIVHTSIGKVSFSPDQIRDNAKEFISTLNKLKPTAAKGLSLIHIYRVEAFSHVERLCSSKLMQLFIYT